MIKIKNRLLIFQVKTNLEQIKLFSFTAKNDSF